MTCKVALRKNETGEVRMIDWSFDWEDGGLYMWTDGNYGCDCNRELFFERAGGNDSPDIEIACGETQFSALYVEMPDGSRTPIDEEPRK